MISRFFLVIWVSALLSFDFVYACTVFGRINDNIEISKNLDWEIDDGLIFINNKNVLKESVKLSNMKTVQWRSKHGSITFNQFGKDFPLGGMNECGLVIEELSYSPTEYSEVVDKKLTELQWIQYNLDNFKTTKEVIDHLNEFAIHKLMFGLHYFVCDSIGDIALIEFINKETKCYNGNEIVVPVLTNNTYENSIRNLKKYIGYGGKLEIKQSNDSMTRFVRSSILLLENKKSFSILNSVKQDDTQWSIVYDITNKRISYKTKKYPKVKILKLSEFKLNGSKNLFIELNSNSLTQMEYNDSIEENFLKKVFDKLMKLELITKEKYNELIDLMKIEI